MLIFCFLVLYPILDLSCFCFSFQHLFEERRKNILLKIRELLKDKNVGKHEAKLSAGAAIIQNNIKLETIILQIAGVIREKSSWNLSDNQMYD